MNKTLFSSTRELTAVITAGEFTDRSGRSLEAEEFVMACHEQMRVARAKDRLVFLLGNGGSAAIASHIRTDFVNSAKMRAVTLHESSVLTCFSNDYGYERAYERQICTMARDGDMLIAVSSSGKSSNILNAVDAATDMGCIVLTLSGFGYDNPLRTCGDLNAWLNSSDYGLVEIGHLFLLHYVTRELT